MLPLLVGEAPSAKGDRYYAEPLGRTTARRLCLMAGFAPDGDSAELDSWTRALYARFECVNLFERHVDAYPWSTTRARERWERLCDGSSRHAVVLLGRRVQHAAKGRTSRYHAPEDVDGATLVAIPHPSGLNRLLNLDVERERVGETLRAVVDGRLA